MINISVLSSKGGLLHLKGIDPQISVKDLKGKISIQEGTPVPNQRLHFPFSVALEFGLKQMGAGKPLPDNLAKNLADLSGLFGLQDTKTLQECQVKDTAVLLLTVGNPIQQQAGAPAQQQAGQPVRRGRPTIRDVCLEMKGPTGVCPGDRVCTSGPKPVTLQNAFTGSKIHFKIFHLD